MHTHQRLDRCESLVDRSVVREEWCEEWCREELLLEEVIGGSMGLGAT